MPQQRTYKAIWGYKSGHATSLPVEAENEDEARKTIVKLLTQKGMPDTYYNAWVRNNRQIICEEKSHGSNAAEN